MISNTPIYRAKRIDNNEYVIGYYSPVYDVHHYIITHLGVDTKIDVVYQMSTDIHKIDPTTLAIHFPDMIDSQGNKIFASLQKDGKGGDIVEGKCRDVNGDAITTLHKPLPYKGLVRFYKETLMSVVIETKDEIIEETKGWNTPIYVNRGEALRWCDCRQDIKVVGIQE